ncbi:MAG TPA: exodeoxyribonuclease V subunit alpha [Flavitalea sp.]|nr:exodeoxyribonuclease V subunit alpha [Flavitalea sp.]
MFRIAKHQGSIEHATGKGKTMETINNVHCQFASFFKSETLEPLAYMVSRKLAEGHICLPLKNIENDFLEDPYFPDFHFDAQSGDLLKNPFVTADPDAVQPFILHNDKLYLQRYFRYETMILQRIQSLIESESLTLDERVRQLNDHKTDVTEILNTNGVPATELPWQTAAVISGALNNFTIITGGPGTGKTTTVAKLLAVLFSMNPALKVALGAPTGKAAARMAESLKNASATEWSPDLFARLQPSTIHRLLKNIPGTTGFRYNASNPLHYDVVIIDESSMIDVALFAKLLNAIKAGTRLIMLGDKDQLASVEAGSMFGDLCQIPESNNRFSAPRLSLINAFVPAGKKQFPVAPGNARQAYLSEHIIELQYSHRFSDKLGIGLISKAVIRNDVPQLEQFLDRPGDPQVTVDFTETSLLFDEFILGYEDYILEKDIAAALRKLNRLRVLCAVREGDQGLYELNRRIEEFLRRKGLLKRSGDFYEHRPVMVTRNNYRLGLYNGDIGILRLDTEGKLRAWFENAEGSLVQVLPAYLTHVETVYAMTIHKSQGSEFDSVMVVLPSVHHGRLLTRELLYTAITRAKKNVIIRSTREIILETTAQQVNRGSGITDRLKELEQTTK